MLLAGWLGPAAPPVAAQVAGGAAGPPGQVTGNVRLGADPAAARVKDVPGLAANPADPRHVVAVTVDALNGRCEHHVSFDSGATWTSGLLAGPADFPPPTAGLPNPLCVAGTAMDGSIAFGSGQRVYTTFAARRTLTEGFSVLVARSDNGGRSFSAAAVALEGGVPNGARFSNPELAVDPQPQGDRVYVGTIRSAPAPSNVVVATSPDGGASWGPAVNASVPTAGAFWEPSTPVVAPGGRVHIAWRNPGTTGSIGVGTSTDGGATFTPVVAAPVMDFPVAGTDSSDPRMAVDPRNGTAYVVYVAGLGPDPSAAARQDHFISANADILAIRSTDGGMTWSPPVRVNDDQRGNLVSQRQGRVAVAPNGRVDVTWQDRRHGYRSPTNVHLGNGEARLGDAYYAFSTDGGSSFSPNRRISDRSTNNDVGIDYRAGTYQFFAPTLVPLGNDSVLFAWMDSREGNFDNDNQDVYVARFDHRPAAGPLPVRRVEAPDGASLSVALSKLGYPGGAEAVTNVGFTSRPATRLVIVNSADPAAALVGSVLARAHLGSVLAAAGGVLTAEQRAEVVRMGPIGAFLLGDESAVTRSVVADVAAAGTPRDQIVRVAPSTTAEMAAIVATSLDRRLATQVAARLPAFDAVVVANPNSPEAAGAAGLAAQARLPLLFTDGAGTLPAPTVAALASLNIGTTLVAGGPGAVADPVLAQLPGARRLAGTDAASVSLSALGEAVTRGLPTNIVYVADSARPLDAGLLAAVVARAGGLQLLVPGADPAAAEAALVAAGRRAGVDAIVTAVSGSLGGPGYRLVAQDGGIFAFGTKFLGSLGATRLNRPIVASAASRGGGGYYLVASDGGVFTFGDATFFGSTGAQRLASPIVSMATTPSGRGYWLVAADGGVFAFGDAGFAGSTGTRRLASPIVAIVPTPSGRGYLLVASDGGVFAFGDAVFAGSTGSMALARPIVGAAGTPTGRGYLLVASDGGVFAFGDAAFRGSTGAMALARPIVGLATSPSGRGYWLVAADGGVFAFGDATFRGSTGALRLVSAVVGITAG